MTRVQDELRSAKVKASVRRGDALVQSLAAQIIAPVLAREYRFHPKRRWRFDLCAIDERLGIEVEGGSWVAGAHTRGSHFESDCEKYAEAACLGFTVLRVTPKQIRSGQAAEWARCLLARARGEIPCPR